MQQCCWVFLCIFNLLLCPPSAESTNDTVTFILVGAKGDLARRFIWPAILELIAKEDSGLAQLRLVIYATSREPANPSSLQEIFSTLGEDNLDQKTGTAILLSKVEYVQLKTTEDYSKLTSLIVSRVESEGLSEVVRVYYLAVPPSAYGWIVSVIDSVGRPVTGKLRVALEKPFGKDLNSALELSSMLQRHLSEDEIFLVDHYLGKLGVQQISHFRRVNDNRLNPLWNSYGVQMVKIVASETATAQGRTGYYDQYGVIRDMLQNHLTEILSFLLCDLGDQFSDKYSCSGKELLSKVYPPLLQSALVGQYLGYTAHFQEDSLGSTFSNTSVSSSTPTFASVVLYIRDPRWTGVPFLLTSGKSMKKKATYVQIRFKDSMNCPAGSTLHCSTTSTELVFMMDSHNPGVCFSAVFDGLKPPYDDWESTSCQKFPYFENGNNGCCAMKCFVPVLNFSTNAYTSVISGVILGANNYFVSVEKLIQSWKVWTPLLNELETSKYQKMFLYTPESLEQSLITVSGTQLSIDMPGLYSFTSYSNIEVTSIMNCKEDSGRTVHEVKGHFSKLVGVKVINDIGSNLASNLSRMILLSALKAVEEHGAFHLALPGGTSPLIIYQHLILNFMHLFPWRKTHIWQTDERCAGRNTSESNLYGLSEYLLEYVPIPYQNIHPLPVDRVCAYFQESNTVDLGKVVPESGFDFVLLGVGLDGHIASLFPKSKVKFTVRHPPIEYVQLSESPSVGTKSRVTLDIEHLTNSRELGIVLMDRLKCGIIQVIGNMSEESYNTSGDVFPFIRLLLHIKQHQSLNSIRLSQLNTVIFVEESCYDA